MYDDVYDDMMAFLFIEDFVGSYFFYCVYIFRYGL